MNILQYLTESSLVFTALYLFYRIFLSRLTFHRVNRAFLLSMLPLSLIIPKTHLSIISHRVTETSLPGFGETIGSAVHSMGNQHRFITDISFSQIIITLYSVVGFFLIARLVYHAFMLILMVKKSPTHNDGSFVIVRAKVNSVFSSFRWIFIPDNYQPHADPTVLEHEKLHAQRLHTFDLLLTESYLAIFWFNPFVYFFRKSLKAVHEYDVDQQLSRTSDEKLRYLQLMLQHMHYREPKVGLYSYFNGLTLKKRVNMITNNNSSKWSSLRYILFIPLVGFLLMSFAGNKAGQPELFPVAKGKYTKISANFGQKFLNPFTNKETTHSGIDIVAKTGVDVMATSAGTVAKVEEDNGWGKLIIIDHGDGLVSIYAHLNGFNAKPGQSVNKGETIGFVGNTGHSTGSHLHFEIRKDGKSIDPFSFVKE